MSSGFYLGKGRIPHMVHQSISHKKDHCFLPVSRFQHAQYAHAAWQAWVSFRDCRRFRFCLCFACLEFVASLFCSGSVSRCAQSSSPLTRPSTTALLAQTLPALLVPAALAAVAASSLPPCAVAQPASGRTPPRHAASWLARPAAPPDTPQTIRCHRGRTCRPPNSSPWECLLEAERARSAGITL